MPYSPDDWVSVGDAATIAGVSTSTIRRYEADGLLACWRTPTNIRRYRRADVEALLVPQTPAPTPVDDEAEAS